MDIDLLHATGRVERSMHTLRDNSAAIGPPKTAAGRRTVAVPPHIVAYLDAYLDAYLARYSGPDPDARVARPSRPKWSRSSAAVTWRPRS
jgi:hypothetical protein